MTNKFKLTTNIPVVFDIQYVDVWPSKDVDGKTYEAQVSIKGVTDNATVVCYLPGKAWAALKALTHGGVIGSYASTVADPKDKVNIPVVAGKNVTICRRQLATDRYPVLVVQQASNGNGTHEPPNIGGPIAGLDDDEELPPVEQAFPDQSEPPRASPTLARIEGIFDLYGVCFDRAAEIAKKNAALSPDVSAMAATLFIACQNAGVRTR